MIELAADLGYDGGLCEQMETRLDPNQLFNFYLLFFFPIFLFPWFFKIFCG